MRCGIESTTYAYQALILSSCLNPLRHLVSVDLRNTIVTSCPLLFSFFDYKQFREWYYFVAGETKSCIPHLILLFPINCLTLSIDLDILLS